MDWTWVRKHLDGTLNPRLILVANDSEWRWMESTRINLVLGWIDFRK